MTTHRLVAALVLGLAFASAMVLRHAPQDPEALGRRLLLTRGHIDAPKIVEQHRDELYVVTGAGKHLFVLQPSCDEELLCLLGFSLLCWDERPVRP